ncbi:restriction endonuclease subunit S (plasmid) [Acinetobacter indicus]|uniref:restriction endonuclease subunit S n=1 Tax=Acinetobacter indicus TaxID=756892 RepID=UPI0035BC485E
MSEWSITKLGDVLEITNGYAFKSVNFRSEPEAGCLPVLKIKNVANGDVHINDVQYHHFEEKLSKYTAQKGDILISLTGNHPHAETQVVGAVSKLKMDIRAFVNQRVAKIDIKPNLADKDYIYFALKEEGLSKYLASQSSGSANQANISKADIEDLDIALPPLPEQKTIASVLSSLDDKIDLLHRQNKTLEAMAETLFRQWFIEEAKEDWDVSPLGDVVKIAYGKNLPTSRLLDSGYPVFGGNGQIGFYDRFLYSEPQVLVSCRGEASGKVNISLPNSFITNNSLILERKENGISFEYLKFYALAYDFGLHISGSAQPQITIDGLFNAEFRWPPLGLVESFTEVVRPLEDKRLTNYIQIQTLENLRDMLLPKLMSGEVRVQYQTEEVA